MQKIRVPWIIILLLICTLHVSGQNSTGRSNALYPVFGLGFGFFYPKDVNVYIEDELSGYDYTINENMYSYYELHAGMTFRKQWFDVTGLFEFAFAPKIITIDELLGSNDYIFYFFNRYSPGAIFNFYIPFGMGKNDVILGGGVHYHFMQFEEYKAQNVGFRIQGGISLTFGRFNLQPYMGFHFAKAVDKSTDLYHHDFELSYTGGQLGVFLSFHDGINNP